jgi:hypothetical protein
MEVHTMRPAPLRPCRTRHCPAAAQPQRYLTNDEAADYLRLSPRTLENSACRRRPAFRSAAASCTPWPTSMPGPPTAASRALRSRIRRAAFGGQPCALIAARGWPSPCPALRCRPGSGPPEREQLDLFRALPGDMAPRDSQDLMAFPFFSLAKSRRVAPIDFRASGITIRVEGTQEHGIATIWDADILIWAASQIVEARDAGLRPSRLMQATPYEILRFIGRGTSLRDYQRLKAALDRLQSTTVATSIRETTGRRLHRFSWINEWKELADAKARPWGWS